MIRKWMTAWAAVTATALSVAAQDDEFAAETDKTWTWGLKAGPSWSMLWGGLEYDADFLERYNGSYIESKGKTTFTAGGMIFANIDARFSFRVEGLFNLRGGTFKHAFQYKDNGKFGASEPYFIEYYNNPRDRQPVRRDTLPTPDSTFRYGKSWNYTFGQFQIPLLAQIHFSQTGARPYFLVGFAPALSLISRVENEFLPPLSDKDAEKNVKTVVQEAEIPVPEVRDAELKRKDASFAVFDMAMIAGAGVRIPVRSGALHIEGRYDLGFLYQHLKVRNQAFSFHVGWEFGGRANAPQTRQEPKPRKRPRISE